MANVCIELCDGAPSCQRNHFRLFSKEYLTHFTHILHRLVKTMSAKHFDAKNLHFTKNGSTYIMYETARSFLEHPV